jgi:outer membrane protein assembly factor BamB
LHAVNPEGTRKWRFGAGATIASSPVIAEDGTIYFGCMGPGDIGRIYALNPNGTEKWQYDTGYWITSDPAIGDDGTIYIGSGDTYLYALNPDGTLKWRFKTGHYVKGPPSIADDGTVYFGSYDDYLYAVYPNNGTMKWRHAVGTGTETNPSIASDGTIYVGGDRLYAINPDGTRKWSFSLTSREYIHKSCPAISAEGNIYFGTIVGNGEGGRIYALNPNGTKKWHEWIANEWVQPSPAIAKDGTVFIGSSWMDGGTSYGYIHAFNRAELKAYANGPYYSLINIPIQFIGSASGGYPPYTWYWDFGDTYTSDEQNPVHTYTTAGIFNVTLTVTDDSINASYDITYAKIKETNNPPNIPYIDGPINGKPLTYYNYDFISTEPDDDEWIYYYVEWGDGQFNDWFGPYAPGEKATVKHYWENQGDYTIRCKSKDNYGDESGWGTLDVTMPINQQNSIKFNSISSMLIQFLQRVNININVGFINK